MQRAGRKISYAETEASPHMNARVHDRHKALRTHGRGKLDIAKLACWAAMQLTPCHAHRKRTTKICSCTAEHMQRARQRARIDRAIALSWEWLQCRMCRGL